MEEIRYSLRELAQVTGVEPRTIRSYIAQGLLRGPESLGRNAYYTDHHLKRLKTITLLRETYGMPLAEIRKYVLMAGDEDIQVVPTWEYSPEFPVEKAKGPVRNYFESPAMYASEPPPGISAKRVVELGPLEHLLAALRELLKGRRVSRQARARPAYEIAITPEVSLLVRGRMDRITLAAFEQLADHLREVLLGGLPPPFEEVGPRREEQEDAESGEE